MEPRLLSHFLHVLGHRTILVGKKYDSPASCPHFIKSNSSTFKDLQTQIQGLSRTTSAFKDFPVLENLEKLFQDFQGPATAVHSDRPEIRRAEQHQEVDDRLPRVDAGDADDSLREAESQDVVIESKDGFVETALRQLTGIELTSSQHTHKHTSVILTITDF